MGEVINFVFDDANEEPAVDLSKSNVEFENNLTNNADGTATIFIVQDFDQVVAVEPTAQ